MAYIGKASIKSDEHMENAVGYITKEEKALSLTELKTQLISQLMHSGTINTSIGERATFINCSQQNTYKDFENLRKVFNQDKGIIAHHYYQSFQKDDNISPEQAHKIGTELAKKMFPNFQVVIATHVDREHIHNHIIVNSCNMITGQKWHSNKHSLSEIRKESDKLCLANGLGIINKNNKYKSIDRTTYQLGLKGKSWKVNLVYDLETAITKCKSKEEFISFLNAKNYTVKYMNRHITITKNGEKKGIRVDTLAKQFGQKFTKENLEKQMGYFVPYVSNDIPAPKQKQSASNVKSNWNYYEQWVFKKNNYFNSTKNNIVRDSQTNRAIKSAEHSVLHSRNAFELVIRIFTLLIALSHRKNRKNVHKRYKVIQTLPIPKRNQLTFGNINYRELTQSSGDNYSIKVTVDKLLRIANQPILYSAKINTDDSSMIITVKAKDKDFLAKLLDLSSQQDKLDEQNDVLSNQEMYHNLKSQAEQSNCKLQYLMITEKQKRILNENFIDFAFFNKDGKINIAFLPEKFDLIKKLIYQNEKDKPKETEQHKNSRIYAQLQKNAALSGEKLCYKTKITSQQLTALSNTNIPFAYFANSEDKTKYNIAYEKKNESVINQTLQPNSVKHL